MVQSGFTDPSRKQPGSRHIRSNQPRTPPSLLHRPHKQSHTARHKIRLKIGQILAPNSNFV